jgi:hypothetical protein
MNTETSDNPTLSSLPSEVMMDPNRLFTYLTDKVEALKENSPPKALVS